MQLSVSGFPQSYVTEHLENKQLCKSLDIASALKHHVLISLLTRQHWFPFTDSESTNGHRWKPVNGRAWDGNDNSGLKSYPIEPVSPWGCLHGSKSTFSKISFEIHSCSNEHLRLWFPVVKNKTFSLHNRTQWLVIRNLY